MSRDDIVAGVDALRDRALKAEAGVERLQDAYSEMNDAICQTLGKALGYPWFKDDQKIFPGATEEHGVCVGEHVAESIAAEAAERITRIATETTRGIAVRIVDRLAESMPDSGTAWAYDFAEREIGVFVAQALERRYGSPVSPASKVDGEAYPPEVVETWARTMFEAVFPNAMPSWEGALHQTRESWRKIARAGMRCAGRQASESDAVAEAIRYRDEVLLRMVKGIDDWNDAVIKIIGRQVDYHWGALEEARRILRAKEMANAV